tara:strand:- start:606 stop:746 length:141 start_codon:yes stop_codon:yes gene_type:complete
MAIESIDQVGEFYEITFVDENLTPTMKIYITQEEKDMISDAWPLTK